MSIEAGDRVRVTEPFGIARAGDVGTVRSFTEERTRGKVIRNPIVDLPGGRGLVPERCLAPDDALLASRSERVPLGDALPPSTAIEPSAPPRVDWSEAPPRPVVAVKVPAPVWEPKEETVTETKPAPLRVVEPEQERGFQRSQAQSRSWTPERRAKFRATMAAKREAKVAERTPEDAAIHAEPREEVWDREPNGPPVSPYQPPDPAEVASPNGASRAGTAQAPSVEPATANALDAVQEVSVSPALYAAPLAGMRDELAASVAALRRSLASAAIEGEDVERIKRLVQGVEGLERIAGEVA